MSQVALDSFGHLLISQVRDETISDWKLIADGTMKGERAVTIRKALEAFTAAQRDTFLSLVPDVVDSVLHHLLWTLERRDDVTIGMAVGKEYVPNLKDISDGLAGELYSDDGWIARFSTEK